MSRKELTRLRVLIELPRRVNCPLPDSARQPFGIRLQLQQQGRSVTRPGLSDFGRLNYPFDSSTEIGIQSLRGGSVRQDRHRSMRISDGRSTPLRIAAVASKSLIASDQRRSS